MIDWVDWLREIATREPAALISLLACEGSAPRDAGTRMLVTAHGINGTIGGGQLEFRAVEQARAILDLPPGAWRIQDYPLGPLLGQCCGGRVRLLVEHVDPHLLGWLDDARAEQVLVTTLHVDRIERQVHADAMPAPLSARGDRPQSGARFVERLGVRRPVYLFGAGHVGQAIVRHGAALPLCFAWFDTRPPFGAIDGVTPIADAAVEHCIADAPEEAALLIMTHDHGLDYRLTAAALQRAPFAFVGLIGSATKRARFLARLTKDGVGTSAQARLTCPIGLPGVVGKEPDVIAIAVLAQLLRLGRP